MYDSLLCRIAQSSPLGYRQKDSETREYIAFQGGVSTTGKGYVNSGKHWAAFLTVNSRTFSCMEEGIFDQTILDLVLYCEC